METGDSLFMRLDDEAALTQRKLFKRQWNCYADIQSVLAMPQLHVLVLTSSNYKTHSQPF